MQKSLQEDTWGGKEYGIKTTKLLLTFAFRNVDPRQYLVTSVQILRTS